MNIRFISTLTAEDESQLAPALLRAVSALLETMPIAYTLRIETLAAEVYQHTHPPAAAGVSAHDQRVVVAAALPRLADA